MICSNKLADIAICMSVKLVNYLATSLTVMIFGGVLQCHQCVSTHREVVW